MPNWVANKLFISYEGKSECPNVAKRAMKQFYKDHLNPKTPENPLDLWKYNDELEQFAKEQRPNALFARMAGFWGGTNWHRADFGYRGPGSLFGSCDPNVKFEEFKEQGTASLKLISSRSESEPSKDPRTGKMCLVYTFNTPWAPFHWSVLGILKNYYPDLHFEMVSAESLNNWIGHSWTNTYDQNKGAMVREENSTVGENDMIGLDDDGNPANDPDDVYEWVLSDKYARYQDVWSQSG